MAMGEPLPKQVFGHPWLLMNGGKMSKSKGNVIYADDLVSYFGVDAVRYFLLSELLSRAGHYQGDNKAAKALSIAYDAVMPFRQDRNRQLFQLFLPQRMQSQIPQKRG